MSYRDRRRREGQARAEPERLAARSARREERLGAYRALVALQTGWLPTSRPPHSVVSAALTQPGVLLSCIAWEQGVRGGYVARSWRGIGDYIRAQKTQADDITRIINKGLEGFVNGMQKIATTMGQASDAFAEAFAQAAEAIDPDTATGRDLDKLGAMVGLCRMDREPEDAFRARVVFSWSTPPPP